MKEKHQTMKRATEWLKRSPYGRSYTERAAYLEGIADSGGDADAAENAFEAVLAAKAKETNGE